MTPFLDTKPRGVFSTRAPARPNPIGISVVRLDKVEEDRLHIRDVDVVDRTPLLDIKPHFPELDLPSAEKFGWLQDRAGRLQSARDNGRFTR